MNIFYNNKITFRIFIVFLVFIFGENGVAQTGITGKVTDKETGEEMIAANIIVTKDGVFVQGETTDIDGNYSIRVDSGIYDLEVSYTGYPTQKITGIIVNEGETTKVDVRLGFVGFINEGCILLGYNIPLIQQDETSTGQKIDKYNIKRQATRNINKIITITPGVSFTP